MEKHKHQGIVLTESGVLRFVQNKIVSDLLDFASEHGFGMNRVARTEYSKDDRVQFAQLIGYSVYGWSTLSYVSDEDWVQIVELMVGTEFEGKL